MVTFICIFLFDTKLSKIVAIYLTQKCQNQNLINSLKNKIERPFKNLQSIIICLFQPKRIPNTDVINKRCKSRANIQGFYFFGLAGVFIQIIVTVTFQGGRNRGPKSDTRGNHDSFKKGRFIFEGLIMTVNPNSDGHGIVCGNLV